MVEKNCLEKSADILVDAQNVCHFIGHTKSNNFCIGDVPGKPFLVPLLGCQRKRASHGCPRTSLWTPKMYAILLITQKETSFVLTTSSENPFLCHFWAIIEKGRPADVLRDVQETSFWCPRIALKILSQ